MRLFKKKTYPGAKAIGIPTKSPIIVVKIPAARAVAKKAPLTLMPVLNGPPIMMPFNTRI